jgi:hypothetical protein
MATDKKLGRFLPNLVLIRDMGIDDHVEFRVQCEVWLKKDTDIQAVEQALIMKTPTELDKAHKIVRDRAQADGAEPVFLQMLDTAFGASKAPAMR